jgi:hypothetical protein
LGAFETPAQEGIPVSAYVLGNFVPLSRLAHDWEFHSSVSLTPAEERTMVREPAQAVPAAIAQRLGKFRVLVVAYIACREGQDCVCRLKPQGETHTAAWVETPERLNLILPCRELDAHDTGFEFLASVGELLRPRLLKEEVDRYSQLLQEEIHLGVPGEIDEEARAAKQAFLSRHPGRRQRSQFEPYRDTSLVSTVAEYMHGMWHDVQIRVGPEHLPLPQLRARMKLMAEMFPPNPGYRVFAEELDKEREE